MSHRLFISYRRKSWAFTNQLADRLNERLDANIFVDFTGMDEVDFESSILRDLRESDAVLLIITEHTFAPDRIHRDDDWVRREIREALTLKKPIVLACVDGLFPPTDLPDDIQGIRGKEGIRFFAEFFDAGVERLATFITRATPIPIRTQPKTPLAASIAAPAPAGGQRTLDEAEALTSTGRFAEAVILLEELRASGYKSKFVDLEAIIADTKKQRDDMLRREEATREYRELAAAARMTRGQAVEDRMRAAWKQFASDFPDLCAELDQSQGLAKRFAPAIISLPPFTLPLLEWIDIPAGKVTLEKGWDNSGNYDYSKNYSQKPLATFDVSPFRIAKYPVTYAQYEAFIKDNGYHEDRFWMGLAKREAASANPSWSDATHPRETVNWYEAMAFTRWLSEKTGLTVMLPTEMQWQWAAVGDKGWQYPYGNTFDKNKSNTRESDLKKTTPVNRYPQGESPFGVMDMSGNVWEWMLTDFYDPQSQNLDTDGPRTLRGGSWVNSSNSARAAARSYDDPYGRRNYGGFRVCVVGVPPFSK